MVQAKMKFKIVIIFILTVLSLSFTLPTIAFTDAQGTFNLGDKLQYQINPIPDIFESESSYTFTIIFTALSFAKDQISFSDIYVQLKLLIDTHSILSEKGGPFKIDSEGGKITTSVQLSIPQRSEFGMTMNNDPVVSILEYSVSYNLAFISQPNKPMLTGWNIIDTKFIKVKSTDSNTNTNTISSFNLNPNSKPNPNFNYLLILIPLILIAGLIFAEKKYKLSQSIKEKFQKTQEHRRYAIQERSTSRQESNSSQQDQNPSFQVRLREKLQRWRNSISLWVDSFQQPENYQSEQNMQGQNDYASFNQQTNQASSQSSGSIFSSSSEKKENKLSGVRFCNDCGFECYRDDRFCSNCGVLLKIY